MGPAAEAWRRQLEDWVIPQGLLDAVDFSPYEWPAALWKRRDRRADRLAAATPNMERILSFDPRSILDIGAGAGGSCLRLAASGPAVTALEPDPGMVQALRERAEEESTTVDVIMGSWPAAAEHCDLFDVVTASHVVHNVADIVPFIRAMAEHAERAVVIQEFERHPWTHLGTYYEAMHGISRPDGPTVEDLVNVIEEAVGVVPNVERWEGDRTVGYESWDEIVEFYGRRVVVPLDRRAELRAVLEGRFELQDGRLVERDRQRQICTVWWPTDGRSG